ncbi:MAG: S-adenosylmethionine:tRNA ribosyltransferase-isomerase [Bacteroidales bacterium]|nr:S-adenosylmethionine:tRNA ribosyltransferase-isomerase [Bacteroidales bacterium]
MINPRDIQISDYNYELPDERIAKYPLAQRNQSKLLIWRHGEIEERHFCDMPELIPAGSMIVFNNTKVIQARMHFRKQTGGVVEVFCLEPEAPKDYQQNFASEHECTWTCLVGNSKKWKEGALSLPVTLRDGRSTMLYCERAGALGASQLIRFYWDAPQSAGAGEGQQGSVSFAQILDAIGELPIPPYLNRATEESDKETYQTVYSRIQGSVAAPTAGLHYTEAELAALREKGVSLQYLTLHVGAGTFKPVKSATIEGHDMHTEFISVPRSVIQAVLDFKKRQQELRESGAEVPRFVATGTTSIRTLESLYYIGEKLVAQPGAHAEDLVVHQWEPYDVEHTLPLTDALQAILDYLDATGQPNLVTATQILIAPGFRYRLVDTVITNFHMPQSTLLLLVSAFVDGESLEGANWHRIYRYAMEHDFRFLSYGDSSILFAD